MVTYDPDSESIPSANSTEVNRSRDSLATPTRESAPLSGKPRPGGTLQKTRRAVAIVRFALIAAAVFCGIRAAATNDVNVEVSDHWTVAMSVAICLLPVGGLFWWVRRPLPELALRRERGRTLGRHLRAAAATIGMAGFFVSIFFGYQSIAVPALLLVAGSLLLYPLALVGRPSKAEIRMAAAPPGSSPDGGLRKDALQAVAEHCTVLMERVNRSTRGSATIRPREPLNVPAPAHLRKWLANGELSTDGQSVSITDANGQVHTRELDSGAGGDNPNGVATLLVRREVARVSTPRGRSAPQYRQSLSLLDPAGRRLLDLELYGWTRSDLITFARAAGLDLRIYAPSGTTHAPFIMRGDSRSPFDLAYPRALSYAKAPGRSHVGDVLLIVGTVIATLAVTTVGWILAAWFGYWVLQGSRWASVVIVATMLLVTFAGMLPTVTVFNQVNRKRHTTTGPPDAI